MLTPQDIQNKEFGKAVFGGYDMAAVDDFLEELTEDYANLYKETAILKGKIKVLVDKVEEYRSTEDAMRMALLTAQKMASEIQDESNKKASNIISEAEEKASAMVTQTESALSERMGQITGDIKQEELRLAIAKERTAAYIEASKKLLSKHADFIEELDNFKVELPDMPAPTKTAVNVVVPVVQEEAAEPEAEPAAEPKGDAALETAKEIDAFVSNMLKDDPEPEKAEGEEAESGDEAEPTRRFRSKDDGDIDWDDEGEPTSPKPKFDFSDLRFGANYKE